jgi:hypothetical protein
MRWMSFMVILAMCGMVWADEKPAHAAASQLELSTERVIIFKDGYGLIVKNGKATADAQGKMFTPQVPEAAILGSFWAMSDGQKMLAMEAGWEEKREVREKRTACITIPELLRANVGRRITVSLGEHRTITGQLAQVLDMPADTTAVASPYAPGFFVEGQTGRSPFEALRSMSEARMARMITDSGYGASVLQPGEEGGILRRELTPVGGNYVVMDETEAGRMVLPVAQVQAVSGKDLQTQMVREEEVFSRTKRLNFDYGKEAAGKDVKLKLFYFTAGLRWIPTYRVSGELKDKAELSLQGEILNESEDLEKAALDLVVGVPNFRFKDTISPLTLERMMRNALTMPHPGLAMRNNEFGNSLNANYSQQAGAWRGREVEGGSAAAMAPELSGAAGEQDMFVYSVKEFSLKKGSRGTVPLWQNTVPMRHVYTLDLRPIRSRSGSSHVEPQQGANPSPLKIATNKIWHQLELANNSTLPWTTGAALSMRENLPLGQDLLTYTPVGGCSLLPLTVAVDMLSSYDEEEVSRKSSAIQVDGTSYSLITKKGTISVTNYRKQKSVMRVSLSTGGRVADASDEGKVKMNDWAGGDWQESGYHMINNHSDVTWDLSIEAGQTKVIYYTVSFYTR